MPDDNGPQFQPATTFPLMNYVKLQPGVPTRMHFTDAYRVQRQILDRDLGKKKWVNTVVYAVDRLEASPVIMTFSVMSEKLQQQLEPYIVDDSLSKVEFIITEMGEGFYKDWTLQTLPYIP